MPHDWTSAKGLACHVIVPVPTRRLCTARLHLLARHREPPRIYQPKVELLATATTRGLRVSGGNGASVTSPSFSILRQCYRFAPSEINTRLPTRFIKRLEHHGHSGVSRPSSCNAYGHIAHNCRLWDIIGDGEVVAIADLATEHFRRTGRSFRVAVDEAGWRFNNLTDAQVARIRESES